MDRLHADLCNAGARGDVERELELAVPTLIKIGLFRLFASQKWIDGNNPGRRLVGHKAHEYLAQARNDCPRKR